MDPTIPIIIHIISQFTFFRRNRTRTRTRLSFFQKFSKTRHPGTLHCPFFSTKKLSRLFLTKEVMPSPYLIACSCRRFLRARKCFCSRKHRVVTPKLRRKWSESKRAGEGAGTEKRKSLPENTVKETVHSPLRCREIVKI